MAKAQRDKGKRVERLAAKALTALTGFPCKRGAQHKGGPDSPDVVTPPGTHVEVKSSKRFMIRSDWITQMQEEAPAGAVPFLLFKQDSWPFLVVCELDELEELAKRLFGLEKPGALTEDALDALLG